MTTSPPGLLHHPKAGCFETMVVVISNMFHLSFQLCQMMSYGFNDCDQTFAALLVYLDLTEGKHLLG